MVWILWQTGKRVENKHKSASELGQGPAAEKRGRGRGRKEGGKRLVNGLTRD